MGLSKQGIPRVNVLNVFLSYKSPSRTVFDYIKNNFENYMLRMRKKNYVENESFQDVWEIRGFHNILLNMMIWQQMLQLLTFFALMTFLADRARIYDARGEINFQICHHFLAVMTIFRVATKPTLSIVFSFPFLKSLI